MPAAILRPHTRELRLRVAFLLAVAVGVAACSADDATPVPTVTAVPVATATPVATAVPLATAETVASVAPSGEGPAPTALALTGAPEGEATCGTGS